MINLEAIEAVFSKNDSSTQQRQEQYVVLTNEKSDAELTLFTTSSLSLEKVNQLLKASELAPTPQLVKTVKVDSMPLTSTGKISYPELKKLQS